MPCIFFLNFYKHSPKQSLIQNSIQYLSFLAILATNICLKPPKNIDWAAFDLLSQVKLFANIEIPLTVLQIVEITNWKWSQKCQATNCVAWKLRKLVFGVGGGGGVVIITTPRLIATDMVIMFFGQVVRTRNDRNYVGKSINKELRSLEPMQECKSVAFDCKRQREADKQSAKLSHRTPSRGQETNAAPNFSRGGQGDHCCGTCVVWHHWHHLAAPAHPPTPAHRWHSCMSSFVPLVVGRVAFVGDRRVYKYFWSSLQTSVQLTISCS